MKKQWQFLVSAMLAMTLILSAGVRNAYSEDTFNFKFAHIFPGPAKQSQICEVFVRELGDRSCGRIKTQYLDGGSLLKPQKMFEGVSMGISDMGFSHIEYTPGRFPVTEVCDLPLGYPSGWVANMVVNDFYHKFKPKEWNGVKVLWMHASNPNVFITIKPVNSIDDLKGLTIRALGRVGDTVRALGALPASLPIMEIYDGLAKGMIQGVNMPFEPLKTFRFAEVVRYVTSTWQVGNIYTFYVIMNKRRYNSLPPDLKEIVDELSGEYKERFALMWNSIDFEGKEYGREKDVQFIELDATQIQKCKEMTAPVIDAYIEDMVGKGYKKAEVTGWISYLRERIDFWTKKQMEYRIPSATGPEGMKL